MTTATDVATILAADVETRTRAASVIAAAAAKLGDAARDVRDEGIRELLRKGQRPADLCRLAGLASSQMARFKPGDKAPRAATVLGQATQVVEALALLEQALASLDQAEGTG